MLVRSAPDSRDIMPAPALPEFLGELAPLLQSYDYLAVGGLVGVEGFGVPAPGETVLIAASIYAGSGYLDLATLVPIAVAAAITGDNIGYFGGRPLALHHVVALYDQLHRYRFYVVVAAALVIGVLILRHVLRHRAASSR